MWLPVPSPARLLSFSLASAAFMGSAGATPSVSSPEKPALAWRTVAYPNGGELRYIPPQVEHRDYPRAALRAGAEGRTIVRLHVDPHGQIISCETVEAAGWPELDERACEIYRARGRFELRNIPETIVLLAPVRWRLEG